MPQAAAILLWAIGVGWAPLALGQSCFYYSDNYIAKAPFVCVEKTGATGSCSADSDCVSSGDGDICEYGTCWQSCSDSSGSTGDCTSIPREDKACSSDSDCRTDRAEICVDEKGDFDNDGFPDTDGVYECAQTISTMHEYWHDCFGVTGGTNPPLGRGARWQAFHRQFEIDFDRVREHWSGFDPIDSLDWCPDMPMPYGHPSTEPTGFYTDCDNDGNPDDHPHLASCGGGAPRPDDVTCTGCRPFPQCLFYDGGGPADCSPCDTCAILGCNGDQFRHCCEDSDCDTESGETCDLIREYTVKGCGGDRALRCETDADCSGTATCDYISDYDSLDDFTSVDEIAVVLDHLFHGLMHGQVAKADDVQRCVGGSTDGDTCSNNSDCDGPTCESQCVCGDSPGDACATDADCAASCVDGVCNDCTGSSCSTDADCSGCCESRCMCGDSVAGGVCGSDSDCTGGCCETLIGDAGTVQCPTRDPMFWRLHKALDDVMRAWQDNNAADVMVVIDVSGSMSSLDSDGVTTKLDAAKNAVEFFADLMDTARTDGQTNRLGMVSYAGSASLDMSLTDTTDSNFSTDLASALSGLSASGCTSIGGGIQEALMELCPSVVGSDGVTVTTAGNCKEYFEEGANATVTDDSDRKAILLLTDGKENRPPCLNSIDPTDDGYCGGDCKGDQLDFEEMSTTQLVAVGFGEEPDGELLTLVAEGQGGSYIQNPATDIEDDLKQFFVKAFANLTDEFEGLDPNGFLPAAQPVSQPVRYTSCGDSRLTFVSGWRTDVRPGDVRLVVTTPNGNLVRPSGPSVQGSTTGTWDFLRVRLPYAGESSGTWRVHLIRPHALFVNGFAPNAFSNIGTGTTIVRRQIQRLCPDGCNKVLLFQQGLIGGVSAYDTAITAELSSGLLGMMIMATDPLDFDTKLSTESWDLVVYAYMGPPGPQPYDNSFSQLVCDGQRAIITESRPGGMTPQPILQCAGVAHDGTTNWAQIEGDGRLIDGLVPLTNPGYTIMSFGLTSLPGPGMNIQATSLGGSTAAIVARSHGQRLCNVTGTDCDNDLDCPAGTCSQGSVSCRSTDDCPGQELCDSPPPDTCGPPVPPVEHHWFMEVLTRGISKLEPFPMRSTWRTTQGLKVAARIPPSYVRATGYDNVNATVEVEYPLASLGCLIEQAGLPQQTTIQDDIRSPRDAALAGIVVPTSTQVFQLYDDGTHGDRVPNNFQWTADLPGMGHVDGTYTLRFRFQFDAQGCTTEREFAQSLFVDLEADQDASTVDVQAGVPQQDGSLLTPVQITPSDGFGNCWGPGRTGRPSCGPPQECTLDPLMPIQDHEDGSYTINVVTKPNAAGARLNVFNTTFDVGVTCQTCPDIQSIQLDPSTTPQHSTAMGTIMLAGPAPTTDSGGAFVFLDSSNPLAVRVPKSIVVPAGANTATFAIEVGHSHETGPVDVSISATYGGQTVSAVLTMGDLPVPSPLESCPNDFVDATNGAGGERLSRFGCVSAPQPPAAAGGVGTAIRVKFRTLHNISGADPDGASVCADRALLTTPQPSLSQFAGQTRWLGAPVEIVDEATPTPLNYIAAPLVCTGAEAAVRDWTPAGLTADFGGDADTSRIYFFDSAVAPCSVYEVSHCGDPLDGATCSDLVLIFTGRMADAWPPFDVTGQPSFTDINAEVNKYKGIPFSPGAMPQGGPPEWHSLQAGNVFSLPGKLTSFLDISVGVDGYKGLPYKEQGPCDPDTATDNCGNPCTP